MREQKIISLVSLASGKIREIRKNLGNPEKSGKIGEIWGNPEKNQGANTFLKYDLRDEKI